jgi:DNA-binding protein H-NS
MVKNLLKLLEICRQSLFRGRPVVPKKKLLATLSNAALCRLRDEIAVVLKRRAEELRKEANRLTVGIEANRRPHVHKPKGNKIAPKYRGPDGSTWCGRGLKPRWLVKEMNAGKKPEDFLILPRH